LGFSDFSQSLKENTWIISNKGTGPLLFVPISSNYLISRSIRRTVIFSLEILGKKNDECILILVIYWKKTGLLRILLQESKPFTSSERLMIWKQISLSHDKDVV
jgi:hypothetical protein